MCASPSLNGKESEGLFFWPPCSLKIEYPFIRHIPIAIVMSISHMSCCATIYRSGDSEDATDLNFEVLGLSCPVWSEKRQALSAGRPPAWR